MAGTRSRRRITENPDRGMSQRHCQSERQQISLTLWRWKRRAICPAPTGLRCLHPLLTHTHITRSIQALPASSVAQTLISRLPVRKWTILPKARRTTRTWRRKVTWPFFHAYFHVEKTQTHDQKAIVLSPVSRQAVRWNALICPPTPEKV